MERVKIGGVVKGSALRRAHSQILPVAGKTLPRFDPKHGQFIQNFVGHV